MVNRGSSLRIERNQSRQAILGAHNCVWPSGSGPLGGRWLSEKKKLERLGVHKLLLSPGICAAEGYPDSRPVQCLLPFFCLKGGI